MGRLKWSIAYLAGPVDHAPDRGHGWRQWITPELISLDIGVLNPLDKSTIYSNIDEGFEGVKIRTKLIEEKRYDEYRATMKEVVRADLAMIDKCDFVISYVDKDIHMCGTYHELSIAASQRKPCLLMCKQGKDNIPPWLWGIYPHEFFFSEWNELFSFLNYVDSSSGPIKFWRFFDMEKIYGRKLL